MKPTQIELLSEGFWNPKDSPILRGIGKAGRAVGGLAGAVVKGTAKALDYVAPELTQPLHGLERGVRDISNSVRQGYDVGSGGLQKAYGDILLDAGYVMDPTKGVTRSGKNKVVIGSRIIGHDKNGKPYGDPKRKISFIFNKDNQFKIVNTSNQDTARLNVPTKRKVSKKKP